MLNNKKQIVSTYRIHKDYSKFAIYFVITNKRIR